ncbi:hypothetical protein PENSUB_4388 [Penicillium subrubescens]|uniref:Kinesin light chain n=1 Tax=Penicillium subrubescens TaxID=1316194 RepID=A0A1Q5UCL7_9EURO|nr:hypothetical protein PENSUB_4388 [Penicillium subrubescens]
MSNKFGQDHLDTLVAMDNLAKTYMKQERWEEASQLIEQVMMALESSFGQSDPGRTDPGRTLATMTDLALTYNRQGRFEEAEKLDIQIK